MTDKFIVCQGSALGQTESPSRYKIAHAVLILGSGRASEIMVREALDTDFGRLLCEVKLTAGPLTEDELSKLMGIDESEDTKRFQLIKPVKSHMGKGERKRNKAHRWGSKW